MNITEKLLEARRLIKETPIKKGGKNSFSKYDYFTPSQVSELVNDVCQELKILPMFSLKKDENGLYGTLTIANIEGKLMDGDTPESIQFQMRTEMPSIKATNETQQMGGCETYTKRYMLMSAFDITDNNLDFDSHDNRPKSVPKAQTEEKGMDIPLAVKNSNSVLELEVLWSTLSQDNKNAFKNMITERKNQLA